MRKEMTDAIIEHYLQLYKKYGKNFKFYDKER